MGATQALWTGRAFIHLIFCVGCGIFSLMNKATVKEQIRSLRTLRPLNFLGLLISGSVNAIGVTMFLIPVNLIDSGFSGTSMLLFQVTPHFLNLTFFLLILNIPFFLLGLKKQGLVFTVYSVFAVAVYSIAAFLIQHVFPIDWSNGSPIAGNDVLLCALFGGLVSGIGSGLTIRFGGAIDGAEVTAVLFAKRLGLSVGTFVMIYNVILYIISAIVFNSWVLPLYSIVAYAVGIKAVDFIVEGLDKAVAALVISSKSDEVAAALSNKLGHGITMWETSGYYSREKKTALYCVANRFQLLGIKRTVHEIDPDAFVTVTEISDTVGRNKISLSLKKKKRIVPPPVLAPTAVTVDEAAATLADDASAPPPELTQTPVAPDAAAENTDAEE